MGTRRVVPLLLAALAMAGCSEQQQPESVAGPSFAPPVDPAVCAPNSLNSQIAGYFPGNSSTSIKTLKDEMLAATEDSVRLNRGFEILQEIGNLSRNATVDPVAGSNLAVGIIRCFLNAKAFVPAFPTDPIYNFAPALDASAGGAFYVRGPGTSTDPVQGAIGIDTDNPEILSGVAPLAGFTWTQVLSSTTVSGGKALIYGYRVSGYPVNNDPFVYEWATIPPAVTFTPGANVALCNGDDSNLMVQESNIGVLGFQPAGAICAAPYSVAIRDTGWGPRALAARLARVMVNALQPAPLQATTLKSGTGSGPTTIKSKFSKVPVGTVILKYTTKPPSVIKLGQTVNVEVRATTPINNVLTGVNGVCVYIVGANNNGQGTALVGSHDSRCALIANTVDDYTESKNLQAGFAAFSYVVTKAGGLSQTATASDDTGSLIGAVGRNGQTFTTDMVKSNVKP
jgi:hypothetical protein